ncbi:hypothetical protein DLREEDagrD3_01380 [Denitratisoma sp. agr-D3]
MSVVAMKRRIGIALVLLGAGLAHAAPDYSGVYDCKGSDQQEGPYTGIVTLTRVKEHSTASHGAYLFKLEVPGFGAYPGHAAAEGDRMAIYFANTDPAEKDYGTGTARFAKNKEGKWRFTKFYFEPDYKGGNHGMEWCRQR